MSSDRERSMEVDANDVYQCVRAHRSARVLDEGADNLTTFSLHYDLFIPTINHLHAFPVVVWRTLLALQRCASSTVTSMSPMEWRRSHSISSDRSLSGFVCSFLWLMLCLCVLAQPVGAVETRSQARNLNAAAAGAASVAFAAASAIALNTVFSSPQAARTKQTPRKGKATRVFTLSHPDDADATDNGDGVSSDDQQSPRSLNSLVPNVLDESESLRVPRSSRQERIDAAAKDILQRHRLRSDSFRSPQPGRGAVNPPALSPHVSPSASQGSDGDESLIDSLRVHTQVGCSFAAEEDDAEGAERLDHSFVDEEDDADEREQADDSVRLHQPFVDEEDDADEREQAGDAERLRQPFVDEEDDADEREHAHVHRGAHVADQRDVDRRRSLEQVRLDDGAPLVDEVLHRPPILGVPTMAGSHMCPSLSTRRIGCDPAARGDIVDELAVRAARYRAHMASVLRPAMPDRMEDSRVSKVIHDCYKRCWEELNRGYRHNLGRLEIEYLTAQALFFPAAMLVFPGWVRPTRVPWPNVYARVNHVYVESFDDVRRRFEPVYAAIDAYAESDEAVHPSLVPLAGRVDRFSSSRLTVLEQFENLCYEAVTGDFDSAADARRPPPTFVEDDLRLNDVLDERLGAPDEPRLTKAQEQRFDRLMRLNDYRRATDVIRAAAGVKPAVLDSASAAPYLAAQFSERDDYQALTDDDFLLSMEHALDTCLEDVVFDEACVNKALAPSVKKCAGPDLLAPRVLADIIKHTNLPSSNPHQVGLEETRNVLVCMVADTLRCMLKVGVNSMFVVQYLFTIEKKPGAGLTKPRPIRVESIFSRILDKYVQLSTAARVRAVAPETFSVRGAAGQAPIAKAASYVVQCGSFWVESDARNCYTNIDRPSAAKQWATHASEFSTYKLSRFRLLDVAVANNHGVDIVSGTGSAMGPPTSTVDCAFVMHAANVDTFDAFKEAMRDNLPECEPDCELDEFMPLRVLTFADQNYYEVGIDKFNLWSLFRLTRAEKSIGYGLEFSDDKERCFYSSSALRTRLLADGCELSDVDERLADLLHDARHMFPGDDCVVDVDVTPATVLGIPFQQADVVTSQFVNEKVDKCIADADRLCAYMSHRPMTSLLLLRLCVVSKLNYVIDNLRPSPAITRALQRADESILRAYVSRLGLSAPLLWDGTAEAWHAAESTGDAQRLVLAQAWHWPQRDGGLGVPSLVDTHRYALWGTHTRLGLSARYLGLHAHEGPARDVSDAACNALWLRPAMYGCDEFAADMREFEQCEQWVQRNTVDGVLAVRFGESMRLQDLINHSGVRHLLVDKRNLNRVAAFEANTDVPLQIRSHMKQLANASVRALTTLAPLKFNSLPESRGATWYRFRLANPRIGMRVVSDGILTPCPLRFESDKKCPVTDMCRPELLTHIATCTHRKMHKVHNAVRDYIANVMRKDTTDEVAVEREYTILTANPERDEGVSLVRMDLHANIGGDVHFVDLTVRAAVPREFRENEPGRVCGIAKMMEDATRDKRSTYQADADRHNAQLWTLGFTPYGAASPKVDEFIHMVLAHAKTTKGGFRLQKRFFRAGIARIIVLDLCDRLDKAAFNQTVWAKDEINRAERHQIRQSLLDRQEAGREVARELERRRSRGLNAR